MACSASFCLLCGRPQDMVGSKQVETSPLAGRGICNNATGEQSAQGSGVLLAAGTD